MKDLRNGLMDDLHTWRLKLYHDPSLDVDVDMLHALWSETTMLVQLLMRLFESDDGVMVQVRCRNQPPLDDIEKPLQNVYEDIPNQVRKL